MTTIKLGVGDDAVEVEDGASVPLLKSENRDARGVVGMIDEMPVVKWRFMGEPVAEAISGKRNWYPIDLAALRRERAPKVETVGGWTNYLPAAGDWSGLSRNKPNPSAVFWTHRPGNTPEKQAAFDAALDAWVAAKRPTLERHGMAFLGEGVEALFNAAVALGYGAKR